MSKRLKIKLFLRNSPCLEFEVFTLLFMAVWPLQMIWIDFSATKSFAAFEVFGKSISPEFPELALGILASIPLVLYVFSLLIRSRFMRMAALTSISAWCLFVSFLFLLSRTNTTGSSVWVIISLMALRANWCYISHAR